MQLKRLSCLRRAKAIVVIEKSSRGSMSTREPKAQKFYTVRANPVGRLSDFEFVNLELLLGGVNSLHPPEGQRGFPAYPETPRVVVGSRNRRLPGDLEQFHAYWFISDRLKLIFESIDPDGFAFQACDVRLRDGSRGPAYWLCDVVRTLNAFGEPILQEFRLYQKRTGNKYCGFAGRKDLVFNGDVIAGSPIFRTPYSWRDIFCDESLKGACKQAGMKGIVFGKTFS
jgi:hypothetical protein